MAKTEMKIAVNETAMIARTVSPLMERQADSGPTDFSLNAAACVQVTARSSSAFFSSSMRGLAGPLQRLFCILTKRISFCHGALHQNERPPGASVCRSTAEV